MENKGFTLAEMLAVIIILAIFGVIGIVSVESIIKKGTEKAYQAQISEIKTAAENLVKIDGEPTWCSNESNCFVSLRYLAFKKYIKLNDSREYINPRTDKPFSLETGSLIKKYGENYIVEAYESLDELETKNPGLLNKVKKQAVAAAAMIYKEKELCTNVCNLKTSDLISNGLLSENFYNEVDITIDYNNKVNIG